MVACAAGGDVDPIQAIAEDGVEAPRYDITYRIVGRGVYEHTMSAVAPPESAYVVSQHGGVCCARIKGYAICAVTIDDIAREKLLAPDHRAGGIVDKDPAAAVAQFSHNPADADRV